MSTNQNKNFLKKNKTKILYISYDGILEPLGNSQVLKYLEHLSQKFEITLISFEKYNLKDFNNEFPKMKKHCKDIGIDWKPKKYNQNIFLISNLINILKILLIPFLLMLHKKFQIVHIRSYMPGLGIIILKKIFKFKLIFDIRGFWADEKVDRLGWTKNSFKYKFFKALELKLFQTSDVIVTLTEASKLYIENHFNRSSQSIKVIRTCVDFTDFKIKKSYEKENIITIGYLGSIDTAYSFDSFLNLIKGLEKYGHSIELKVLSKNSPQTITTYLKKNKLEHVNCVTHFAKREELATFINEFDLLGFSLKESFSLIASMPTKIAESLACGTPIVCNNFNADIEAFISKENIGVLYDFSLPLDDRTYRKICNLLNDPSTPNRCHLFAKNYFSLITGVEQYNAIYNSLK